MRTQFLYFFMLIILLFVYSIHSITVLFALPMKYILQPVIGFGGLHPIYTILFAAVITAVVNTIARHYFTDYFRMAEMQHRQRKLSERYRAAIRSRNKQEMDAVRAEQSKSMTDSLQVTQQQMKPTYVTMILTVLIFAWLIGFMQGIASSNGGSIPVASPFGAGDLMYRFFGFYIWIGLYSLFSIVISYPLQVSLRMFFLRRSVMA